MPLCYCATVHHQNIFPASEASVKQKEQYLYVLTVDRVLQSDPGDLFYIIKEGEAAVYQDTPRGTRLVNKLFRSDFFGEQALLRRAPRMASVEAVSERLVCLALRRDVFVALLGDLGDIMNREKSPQVRVHLALWTSASSCSLVTPKRTRL